MIHSHFVNLFFAAALIFFASVPALSYAGGDIDSQKAEFSKAFFLESFPKVIEHEGENPLPILLLKTLEDKEIELDVQTSEYRLINLWATWCAPCIHEIPTLTKLDQRLNDLSVVFISFDFPDDARTLKALMNKKGIPEIETYYSSDNQIWKDLNVQGLPTTYLISPEGQILYTFLGDTDWNSEHAITFFENEFLQ